MRSFPRENRRGMALVVVLTVVVLAAILVAAFVSVAMLERSSSGHYASSLRAEEVARAGYTTVLADLRREISAGSVLVTNASGNILFAMPRTNWTMLPQTNAVLTNAPALVRFSSTNLPPAFTNTAWFDTSALPPNRASAVSTATRSRNNRSISAAAWLAPQFAPTNNAATLAALTNNPPTWTYVTRSGARALTDADAASAASESAANTNYVVCRYAFAVYESGGMLDANLAGGATNLLSPALVASKSHQAFADLTRLGLSTTQIGTLVEWRNYATADSTNSYLASLRSTNGFTVGTTGDRAFFSRQDFLRYADVNSWTNTAIANVTTFARSPATPGFYPTYDASNFKAAAISVAATNSYRSNALTSTNNPALLRVRKANGEPVVEQKFNLDRLLWLTREGPMADLSPGNPIYDSALAGLGGTTAAADFLAQGTDANIKKCFGLVWDDNAPSYNSGPPSSTTGELGKMWIYCSPEGSLASRSTSIKSLAEVGIRNREPDLFELMQATILTGSLGQTTGDPNFSAAIPFNANTTYGERQRHYAVLNGNPTGRNLSCNTPEFRMDKDSKIFHAESKYQIARIIANMVDQADNDSFPTVLRVNEENIWGIEDLPLFNGVGFFSARPLSSDPSMGDPNQRYVHQWTVFSLWNPHQISTSAGATPTTFRLICRSGVTGIGFYRSRYYIPNQTTGVIEIKESGWPATQIETFTDGSPSWVQFSSDDYGGFREPKMVTPATNTTTSPSTALGSNRITIGRVDMVGLHIGRVDRPDHPDYVPKCAGLQLPVTAWTPVYAENLVKFPIESYDGRGIFWGSGNSLNLELQYLDPSGNWRTYDAMYGFVPYWTQYGFTNYLMPDDPDYVGSRDRIWADCSTTSEREIVTSVTVGMETNNDFQLVGPAHIRTDPRTTRFNVGRVFNRYFGLSPTTPNRMFRLAGQIHQTMSPYDASNPSTAALIATKYPGYVSSSMVGPTGSSTFFPQPVSPPDHGAGAMNVSMFANNFQETAIRGNYTDPDFVQRWGDAGLRPGNHPGTANNTSARPIMLNRPFRNVGELGVVFRDAPWRTLDLLSEKSADAGLLEVFSVGESASSASAGRVNLNTAGRPVLEALLTGADLSQASPPTTVSLSASTNLVTDILTRRVANGPIENLSQLPKLFPQTNTVDANYPAPKSQREGAVRALAGVGSTRTWNLLLDVIAQSGRLTPNAMSLGSDFIVQGQRRYWLNVSLDRFTGEVIASQLEPYED